MILEAGKQSGSENPIAIVSPCALVTPRGRADTLQCPLVMTVLLSLDFRQCTAFEQASSFTALPVSQGMPRGRIHLSADAPPAFARWVGFTFQEE